MCTLSISPFHLITYLFASQLLSEASVSRRRASLGLLGSSKATATLPNSTKRQLVLDALAKDPKQRKGPRVIKELIGGEGTQLTR